MILCSSSLLIPAPVWAQTQQNGLPHPPDVSVIDSNSVNVPSLLTSVSVPLVAIGGSSGLSVSAHNDPNGGINPDGAQVGQPVAPSRYLRSGFYPKRRVKTNYGGMLETHIGTSDATHTFSFNGISETFVRSAGYPNRSKRGGILISNSDGVTFTYINRDGDKFIADTRLGYAVTSALKPNGELTTVHYKLSGGAVRISAVTSSLGWMMKYLYNANGEFANTNSENWLRVARIVGVNQSVEYCAPAADTCTFAQTWPDATITWPGDLRSISMRNQQGGTTTFGLTQFYEIASITPPGFTSPSTTYVYCTRFTGSGADCRSFAQASLGYNTETFLGLVYSATQAGQTTRYDFINAAGGYVNYARSANALFGSLQINSNAAPNDPPNRGALTAISSSQRGNRVSLSYTGYADNRVTLASYPGSVSKSYTYDDRGNVLTETVTAKDGSGQTLTTSIGYETGCTNPASCNKPLWRRDPKGNQTDYTYDPAHGGLLTETGPAVAGIRPQTRYTYVQRRAWTKNEAGAYVASPYIWMLASTSICRSSAATGTVPGPCVTGGDEVRTTYDYGPDAGPNNLLTRGVVVAANGKSRRTCFKYDRFGNKISETTPAAGVTICS